MNQAMTNNDNVFRISACVHLLFEFFSRSFECCSVANSQSALPDSYHYNIGGLDSYLNAINEHFDRMWWILEIKRMCGKHSVGQFEGETANIYSEALITIRKYKEIKRWIECVSSSNQSDVATISNRVKSEFGRISKKSLKFLRSLQILKTRLLRHISIKDKARMRIASNRDKGFVMRCSVVAIDMSQYRKIARHLQNVSPEYVGDINEMINSTILRSIDRSGAVIDIDAYYSNTGDGGLVAFKSIRHAIKYCKLIFTSFNEFNLKYERTPSSGHYFRCCICTGPINIRTGPRHVRLNGMPVSDSNRMLNSSATGTVLVCQNTYPLLGTRIRRNMRFSPKPILIPGKPHDEHVLKAYVSKHIGQHAPHEHLSIVIRKQSKRLRRH